MSVQLKVPDIGDFEQVEIIEVIVKVGDEIKKGDPVVTLESDKSSVEVPSTIEGKITNIKVKVGDKVSKDDLILETESSAKSSSQDAKKDSSEIPKNTKNLIEEAEKTVIIKKEELSNQVINEPDKEINKKENIKIAKDKVSATIKNGDIEKKKATINAVFLDTIFFDKK